MLFVYTMIVGILAGIYIGNNTLAIVVFVASAICILLYPLVMERFNKGQTLGKWPWASK